MTLLRTQFAKRPVNRNTQLLEPAQQLILRPFQLRTRERQQRVLFEGLALIRDDQFRVKLPQEAGSRADRTGSLAAVKGKQARVGFLKPETAGDTEEMLAIGPLIFAVDMHRTTPNPEGRLEQSLGIASIAVRTVHPRLTNHNIDVVLFIALQTQTRLNSRRAAVDPRLLEAQLACPG